MMVLYCSILLRSSIYYNIITVLRATIIQLKSFKTFLKLQVNASKNAFKEGHAAKSAEERRRSNHNIRVHPGEIYNNSNNQSSSLPNNNKT
jgi:hypothetical protein